MFGLGERAVGLDISEGTVRVVVLKKRGKQFVLAGVGVGEVASWADEAEATQAILTALQGAGAKRGDPVVCSIGGPEVVVKNVKLPTNIPLPQVLDAVRWHFRENSLLPAADVLFDAQIVKDKVNGEMNVLAVCAPKALIDQRFALMGRAHLTLRHMDVEPLATVNAVLDLQRVALEETLALLSIKEREPFLALFNRQTGNVLIRYLGGAGSLAAMIEEIRTSVAYFQADLAAGSRLRCFYCSREELFAQIRDEMGGLFSNWDLSEPAGSFDPLSVLEWEKSILPPGKSIEGPELAHGVGLALRAL